MNSNQPPKIKKFPAAKQKLLDNLLDQNAEGTISEADRATLEALVSEAEELIVFNSHRLAEFAQSQPSGPPTGAVPVTVWVTSEVATR
jgi:hypothetical protein